MAAIKTIHTRGIQSHNDVLIELPETGLVVFSGDNSNGKSVIRKVLEDTIAYNINKAKVRKSLISKDRNEGSLEIIKYDGSSLYVNINMEASQTWVRLIRANGEEVTRYLADKNIPELIREFGFHYNDTRDTSLNICDSDDSILFFRTSHVTNGDILISALTDMEAQTRYDVLYQQYQEALANRRQFLDNLQVAQTAKEALILYDIQEEQELHDICARAASLLSKFYWPRMKEVPEMVFLPTVNVRTLRLQGYTALPHIPVTRMNIRDIRSVSRDLIQIEKGVCPTCQRPFSLHQTCTSEM